jgi:hypothetical protein
MSRLVEAKLATAGKDDGGQAAPARFLNRQLGVNAMSFQIAQGAVEVVTHQIELVVSAAAGMHRQFSRGQGEDQPAIANVDPAEMQDVPKEGAVGLRIGAFDDDVRAGNQRIGYRFPTFSLAA